MHRRLVRTVVQPGFCQVFRFASSSTLTDVIIAGMGSSFFPFLEEYVSCSTILHSIYSGRHLHDLQPVKNQLERVPDQFSPLWKWRVAEQGKPNNGLSEGEGGMRDMSKLQFADRTFP